jgi:hypothetical protein
MAKRDKLFEPQPTNDWLEVLTMWARLAASSASASNSSTLASRSRLHQRVRFDGSIGGLVYMYVLPVNTCYYVFSSHRQSDESKACCKYSRAAIKRGKLVGRPRCGTNSHASPRSTDPSGSARQGKSTDALSESARAAVGKRNRCNFTALLCLPGVFRAGD